MFIYFAFPINTHNCLVDFRAACFMDETIKQL